MAKTIIGLQLSRKNWKKLALRQLKIKDWHWYELIPILAIYYYITCESWHENISSYQYSLLDQIIDIIGIGERGAWWVHFFPKMGPKQPKIAGWWAKANKPTHNPPCGGDVGAWIDLAWPAKIRLGHKNCCAPQSGLIFCPIFQIMVGVAMPRYIVVLLDTSFEIISIY